MLFVYGKIFLKRSDFKNFSILGDFILRFKFLDFCLLFLLEKIIVFGLYMFIVFEFVLGYNVMF